MFSDPSTIGDGRCFAEVPAEYFGEGLDWSNDDACLAVYSATVPSSLPASHLPFGDTHAMAFGSGWAGQANKGAGIFMFLGPDDPVDRFLDYHTRNIGIFLEDQELMRAFATESHATIERLDSWCHTFCRGTDGDLATETFVDQAEGR